VKCDCTFFTLGWARCDFHKKHARTCYAELVFFNPMEFVGHVVHSSASGARNVDTLFLMLGWGRCDFHQKHTRTRYAKLVFLHLVGSASHEMHSGASEV
jgi:hypothetical protein